jgi:hypothetical protein
MGEFTRSSGGSTPPSGTWAKVIALFLSIVLIITILLIVPDPRTAIGLAVVAVFTAVEAAGRLLTEPERRGSRSFIAALIKVPLELPSAPGSGGPAPSSES